jgi:hypothetical protein
LARVLQQTAELALASGNAEQHAWLGARLAVFRARLEAGDTGPLVAIGLTQFGQEFNDLISVKLGRRL